MTVSQRIKELQNYLKIRKADYTPEDNFVGEYESKTKLFKGNIIGNVTSPDGANGNSTALLQQIVDNQNLDRLRYEVRHAVVGDLEITDWGEIEIPPNYQATFQFLIDEGRVMNLTSSALTYADDMVYTISDDGRWHPSMQEYILDYGGGGITTYDPPLRCYSTLVFTVSNVGDESQLISISIFGFLRRYQRSTELFSEERSIIEKTISTGGSQ